MSFIVYVAVQIVVYVAMKHCSHRSHCQTKQFSQYSKFAMSKICLWDFFDLAQNSQLYKFLLKLMDFVCKILWCNSKCDHTFSFVKSD